MGNYLNSKRNRKNKNLINSNGLIIKNTTFEYDFFKTKYAQIYIPSKGNRLKSCKFSKVQTKFKLPLSKRSIKRIIKTPGIRPGKVKKHLTDIKIPKENFTRLGFQVTAGVLSIIAFPNPLAIISVCIGLMLNITGIFEKNPVPVEAKCFYAYLIAIDLDAKKICKKNELERLFNKEYLLIMKNDYSNIQLNNDFGFIFDALYSRGYIVDSDGYYQARKRFLVY